MTSKSPFFSKSSAQRGYRYFQDNTVLLIDRIVQLIDIKILTSIAALALICLGISVFWAQISIQNVVFTPEQIVYLSLPDVRIQTTFYILFCVTIFVFFLLAGVTKPQWFLKSDRSDWRFSSSLPQWFQPWLGLVFWVAVILLYEPKARNFLLALVVAYLMKEAIRGRFNSRTIGFTLLGAVFILCVLPFGFQHQMSDGRLWVTDIHWSAVLGSALYTNSFAGQELDSFAGYGVFLNELVAASRNLPIFETLGGTWTFLKVINLLFCGLVFVAIVQRIGTKSKSVLWASALFILLVFSGMVSGITEYLNTPNLLPIRFLMIPVTVILAYYLANLNGHKGSIFVGLIAPVLIFYNFETSIYCILALSFGLFVESAKKDFLNILISGVAMISGFIVSGLILILLIFDTSLTAALSNLVSLASSKIQSGSSGYGGLSAYFFAPFFIIMTHVAVLFSRQLLSIKEQTPFSRVEFQSIVIVVLIITIGPYIMNRFHVLNMWVPFLLYALLVLPKLIEGPKTDRVLWSFILVVLIIPFIFGNPARRLISKDFVATISDRFGSRLETCLDGVPASPQLCAYAFGKADELKELSRQYPDSGWMSGLALHMTRLTDIQPALEQKAPFFFGHREETRNILVKMFEEMDAPIIFIDKAAPDNLAGLPPFVEQFQKNLLQDAGYRPVEETAYWVITRKER
jgi:hypothetical protein